MQLDQTTMVPAILVKRYKRFLSDHRLESGEVITASCPNTGTMLGLTTPGSATWLVLSWNRASGLPVAASSIPPIPTTLLSG